MSADNNPDQVIAILPNVEHVGGEIRLESATNVRLNQLISDLQIHDINDPSSELTDVEDEESTPITSIPENGTFAVNSLFDHHPTFINRTNVRN